MFNTIVSSIELHTFVVIAQKRMIKNIRLKINTKDELLKICRVNGQEDMIPHRKSI